MKNQQSKQTNEMGLKETIKSNAFIKKAAIWALQPIGEYRPRWWVRNLLNPIVHKVSSKAVIRRRIRLDVFPYKKFIVGDGCIIEDYTLIANAVGDVVMGKKVLIGAGSKITGPVTFGDNILLAQNVVMSGLNHDFEDVTRPIVSQGFTTKEIRIDDGVWIGAGALIIPGIHIGKNAVVGAGSVVTKDVPAFSVVVGNPARVVKYYNFDVHPTQPDDIYVFFKKSSPNVELTAQRHIIPSLPGNPNYNDFWQVSKVMVPDYYVPNTLTSEAEILASGLKIVKTNMIVNCPVVPFGSTATQKYGGGTNQLVIGWYNDSAVAYFNFAETSLMATSTGQVPIDDIYVEFNDNTAGPASGFKTEPGTTQTHNVIASSPGSSDYTPLWQVHVVDNAYFNKVSNLTTAMSANILNENAALVNCPVIK